MSITLEIDYGNCARKLFTIDALPNEPIGDVFSLWDLLAVVRDIKPGLEYELDSENAATDRGGLEFPGKIVSVDGLVGEWVVLVGGVEQTELRRARFRMANPREVPRINDGDSVILKRK